jgi:cbb3-type cytochrome oxidase subunit 3
MIEVITANSGLISLLGFCIFFGAAAIYALRPKNKKRFEEYKNIPLKD